MVYTLNKTHTIFGWIYIILVKVPLLNGWYGNGKLGYIMFIIILSLSIFSYAWFLYLKFFRKKICADYVCYKKSEKQIRIIKSSKDLDIYSGKFFIFGNYVYNISSILSMHPGGWKIINEIKGREVDRFLFGVDPI